MIFQIKNEDRVRQLGEMSTLELKVNALLYFVADQTSNITACFLEHSCDTRRGFDYHFMGRPHVKYPNLTSSQWSHFEIKEFLAT